MKENISHTKIVPYQAGWPQKFEKEKKLLRPIFGDQAISIDHIGSTSVFGLPSKPIIDLVVLIADYHDALLFETALNNAGYKCDLPGNERRFYIKGDPIEYHLSIAYANRGGFLDRQILFRDYLRSHPNALAEYASLKLNLLQQDKSGIGNYVAGKSDFIYKILSLAGWPQK